MKGMVADKPIRGVNAGPKTHPCTRLLALAFPVMVDMAQVANILRFLIERGNINTSMVCVGGVQGLNLRQQNRRRRLAAGTPAC
jgi:hypothetical protein